MMKSKKLVSAILAAASIAGVWLARRQQILRLSEYGNDLDQR